MMAKTFDMGKNVEVYREMFRQISATPVMASYIDGAVAQFQKDLLATGRACMPDGEIVEAFPQMQDAQAEEKP
jgi:hypothetical protein